jgi:hypothetical protein
MDNSITDGDFAFCSDEDNSVDSSLGKRKFREQRAGREELKWYPAIDKILLQDCLEKEVWTASRSTRVQMFQAVADSLKSFDGVRFRLATQRNCQRRFNFLYETFIGDNFAKMNQSGTTEEYEEREILLQNIKDCTDNWKAECVSTTAQTKAMEKELAKHGKYIREAAVRGLAKQHESEKAKDATPSTEESLGKLVNVLCDMAQAAKPIVPPVPETITFEEAGIVNVRQYLEFAGILNKWHQEYVQMLDNYGFDTPHSLWLANGQQLCQAGLRVGHVNLLLEAKAKLKKNA